MHRWARLFHAPIADRHANPAIEVLAPILQPKAQRSDRKQDKQGIQRFAHRKHGSAQIFWTKCMLIPVSHLCFSSPEGVL